MKKLTILLIIGLCFFGGFQTYQLVSAKQQVDKNSKVLATEMAINAFKIQYGQVLDKIKIQGVEQVDAKIIYWTENVSSKDGKIILHGSAIINGTVLDFPNTTDVTDYINGK